MTLPQQFTSFASTSRFWWTGQYSRTSYNISYALDWSRWPSRPIRILRYIVTCTRIGIELHTEWTRTVVLSMATILYSLSHRPRSSECDWSRWLSRPITCLRSGSVLREHYPTQVSPDPSISTFQLIQCVHCCYIVYVLGHYSNIILRWTSG